jgi:hypothetical protein
MGEILFSAKETTTAEGAGHQHIGARRLGRIEQLRRGIAGVGESLDGGGDAAPGQVGDQLGHVELPRRCRRRRQDHHAGGLLQQRHGRAHRPAGFLAAVPGHRHHAADLEAFPRHHRRPLLVGDDLLEALRQRTLAPGGGVVEQHHVGEAALQRQSGPDGR